MLAGSGAEAALPAIQLTWVLSGVWGLGACLGESLLCLCTAACDGSHRRCMIRMASTSMAAILPSGEFLARKRGIFCPGQAGSFQLAPCPSTGSTRILFSLVSFLLSFSHDVPGCSTALASLLYKLKCPQPRHSAEQSSIPPRPLHVTATSFRQSPHSEATVCAKL